MEHPVLSEPSASIMLMDSKNATCVVRITFICPSALLAESFDDYNNTIPVANSVPATREELELEDIMHMHADFEADAGSRYR